MKILRTIGVLALVAGLVLGGVSSAFAQDGPPGKRHGFFGTVDSVSGYDVTLVTKEGSTVVVTLTDTAKYMLPGVTKGPVVGLEAFEIALDDDIAAIEGRRLAVLVKDLVENGTPPPNFTATAVRLMLMPSPDAPPLHAHRVGVVQVFSEGSSITIIDKDGEPHPFALDETTVYRPDDIVMGAIAGGFVTVVTTGDPKLGTAIAKAIVLHKGLPDWAPEL